MNFLSPSEVGICCGLRVAPICRANKKVLGSLPVCCRHRKGFQAPVTSSCYSWKLTFSKSRLPFRSSGVPLQQGINSSVSDSVNLHLPSLSAHIFSSGEFQEFCNFSSGLLRNPVALSGSRILREQAAGMERTPKALLEQKQHQKFCPNGRNTNSKADEHLG